jgi:hypothetical protein
MQGREAAALQRMTVKELRALHADVFGNDFRTRNEPGWASRTGAR